MLKADTARKQKTDTSAAVLTLIVLATLIRLGFAWALGLGVDESYMVATGRQLRWSYFDHPPASWWLQWAGAHLFGTEAPLAVRTPFILCFALSTWLMYRLTTAVANERAGLWAALALSLSPVFSVTTGTWVLPDGPLVLALLVATVCLVHALPARGRIAWAWWLGAGACAGLALFSKYTAILTLAGAGLYLLITPRDRRWLGHPAPYVAVLLAALIFSPVVVWNATHGWASFAFQGSRATGLSFRPAQLFIVLGGEALFVLPWIWLGMIVAVWRFRRTQRLLICLAAPPIVVFALVGVFSSHRVLFHWAAPGYLMLFPMLGAWLAEHETQRWPRRIALGTAALVIGLVVIVSLQVRLDLLHPLIAAVARHDPDLEAIDWTSLRPQLEAHGLLHPGTVVAAADWRDAGKIAHALGPSVPVICLSTDAREFAFAAPASRFLGRDILVLALDHPERVQRDLAPLFEATIPGPDLAILFRGHPIQPVTTFTGLHMHAVP